MAEINVDIKIDASGNTVRFRSSGRGDLPPGAGQVIVPVKDGSGNVVKVSGQVPNSTVVVNNPA